MLCNSPYSASSSHRKKASPAKVDLVQAIKPSVTNCSQRLVTAKSMAINVLNAVNVQNHSLNGEGFGISIYTL